MKNNQESNPLPPDEFRRRFSEALKHAAVAARFCLGDQENLVDDVVAGVLLTLWQLHGHNNLPDNPENWAFQAAFHRAIGVARMEGLQPPGMAELEQPANPDLVLKAVNELIPVLDPGLAAGVTAAQNVLDAFVSVARARLDPHDQLLFEAFYDQKLSLEEACRQFDLSARVVRYRWMRMLAKLSRAVRLQLGGDSLAIAVHLKMLDNEETLKPSLVGWLRLVLKKDVRNLRQLLGSALKL